MSGLQTGGPLLGGHEAEIRWAARLAQEFFELAEPVHSSRALGEGAAGKDEPDPATGKMFDTAPAPAHISAG